MNSPSKQARYPNRTERVARRAQKRHRELCQVWIRFAEALKQDGIKLGEFEGIDNFERFLWMRCKEAENEANKAERAVVRAAERRAVNDNEIHQH